MYCFINFFPCEVEAFNKQHYFSRFIINEYNFKSPKSNTIDEATVAGYNLHTKCPKTSKYTSTIVTCPCGSSLAAIM
jgi:hypothetical protein